MAMDFDVKPALEQLWMPTRYSKVPVNQCFESYPKINVWRKSTKTSDRSLGNNVCMWANTAPEGGLIAFGIQNDGAIKGCKHLSPERLNGLEKFPTPIAPMPTAKQNTSRCQRGGSGGFYPPFPRQVQPERRGEDGGGRRFRP